MIAENKPKLDIIKTCPIRMCIICKNRFFQNLLQRYQIKDMKLVSYLKHGRSFYMCVSCIKKDKKRIQNILNHKYNINFDDDCYEKLLKEMVSNGRES